MELIAYLFIYLTTCLLIINPKLISKKYFFLFWFFSIFLLCIIIRSTIYDKETDIINYIALMQLDYVTFYFDREFIWFYGTRYLYDFFGDGRIVFIFLDTFLILFLYNGIKLIRNTIFKNIAIENTFYIFFAIFLFFPFVEGIHNVYRQIFALSVFILSFGYLLRRNYLISIFVFSISIFIHNSILLFIPLFILPNKKLSKYLLAPVIILLVFLIEIFFSTDNIFTRDISQNIGRIIPYIYSFSLFSIFILIYLIKPEKISSENRRIILMSSFTLALIFFTSIFSLNSLPAQRLYFAMIGFLFPVIALYIDGKFREDRFVKLLFFHLSISPLFILFNQTIDLSI